MPHLEAPSLVGQVLDNRYKITRKLGEGGMGEVYAADHVHIEKRFAIKLLRPEIVSNPEAVSRFRQEARSSSSIGHRNIIAIEDFGTLNDGRIYMCMELLNGAALNDLITTPQPVDRLLNILIQTGHGLAAAHAKGIVHRDMKPENVFVTVGPNNEDIPKLLDFGIAKVAGNDGQNNLTRTGTIFGTPFYMAPEQALGNPVDARTDIYAVGVIMYEVFAGSLPFQGESFMGILTQHITTEPEPVAQRASKAGRPLPPGLAEIITRCMQKNPAQRFSTMDELVNALIQIYRGIAGAGMSTYMEAFPTNPTSGRMAVPTPGPMTAAHQPVAATMGPNVTPQGMQQMHHPGTGPHTAPNQQYRTGQQYPSGQGGMYDPNATANPFPVKKSKTGLIIAIIAVLAVGGGVAAFVIVSAQKEGGNTPGSGSEVVGDGTGSATKIGTDKVGADAKTVAEGADAATQDGSNTVAEGPDAGSTIDPPLSIDAGVPKVEGVEVQVFVKNGGVLAFEVYEEGSKIFDGPGNITITPGSPRTVVIKARGFKDKTVTISGNSKKEAFRLDRDVVAPKGCTASSCPSGQTCDKKDGKCKFTSVLTGCTATSCPAGQTCEGGKCKVSTTPPPPRLDCTNKIVDGKDKKCVRQYCKAHPEDDRCGLE
jgi:serine/threonine-protein kinase